MLFAREPILEVGRTTDGSLMANALVLVKEYTNQQQNQNPKL